MSLKVIKPRPNGELLAFCPHCPTRMGSPDKKGSLCINIKKKVVFCFRCSYSGGLNPLDVIGWSRNNRMAADTASDYAVKRTPTASCDDGKRMIELWPTPASPLATRTFDYAMKRGLDPKVRKLYYSPDIPYYLIIKQDNWWQGRTIKEGMTPKNLFPPTVPKQAMYIIKPVGSVKEVVIVEGIFDAESIREKGRMVIAILGSQLKNEQLISLSRLLRDVEAPVKIFLDDDAVEKAKKIRRTLRESLFNTVLMVNWGELKGDPDSLERDSRERLLSSAS